MSDILIRGMKMPKEGFVEIQIRSDGTVVQTGKSKRFNGRDYYVPYKGAIPQLFTAVSVPPHGRLIDADELERGLRQMAKYQTGERQQGILGCCETIRLAKTIIQTREEVQ